MRAAMVATISCASSRRSASIPFSRSIRFGCPPKSANAAVSGGSGAWNFGSPGSSAMVDFTGHRTMSLGPSPCMEQLPDAGVRLCRVFAAGRRGLAGRSREYDLHREPFNRSQFDCVLPACLQTLQGSSIPTAPFSPPGPGYTNDSAIINVANGQPVVGPASVSQVKSKMGTAAFNSATFTLVGGPGSDSTLRRRSDHLLLRDGPRFQSDGETLRRRSRSPARDRAARSERPRSRGERSNPPEASMGVACGPFEAESGRNPSHLL